jgi:hypothetical protein
MSSDLGSDLGFLEGLDESLSDVGGQTWGQPPLWQRCADCSTQSWPKVYCDQHRCNAMNARGQRCGNPAEPDRGYEYCNRHGCRQLLQFAYDHDPAVYCMNRREAHSMYCADHQEPQRRPDLYTYQ